MMDINRSPLVSILLRQYSSEETSVLAEMLILMKFSYYNDLNISICPRF